MATEHLFQSTPYAKSCEAKVVAVDERGIELDRTVFYPTGGGQPGDRGRIRVPGWGEVPEAGDHVPIVDTVKGPAADRVIHMPADGARLPDVGAAVVAVIDWPRRHRLMRMHTCMHLLSAVLPYPVTGGQVGEGTGRLDFDIPEAILDKDEIAATLNALVQEAHPVATEWITDEALAAAPELVKTMAVKPPTGLGRVRLVKIATLDLQPCGGTHVASTAEIGGVVVTKIKKKGRLNRRVSLALIDTDMSAG
jgi:misacylated tRNA(Ala) deacylase